MGNTNTVDTSTLFTDKNFVITGGSRGIGYAIIEKLLACNAAHIHVLDIIDYNDAIAKLTAAYPQRVTFIQTDVSNKGLVWRSFTAAVGQVKYIDYVICNAGILDEHDYEKTINVNLLGMMHCNYTAIDLMSLDKGGRGGVVVNISSVAGLDSLFSVPAYGASKNGIVGLTRAFGNEFYFKKFGIKFITICPGITDTAILDKIKQKYLFPDTPNAGFDDGKTTQKPEDLATCFVEVLTKAENGSVWMIDDGKLAEINMTKYWLK